MIMPRHSIDYKLENSRLVSPYLKRRMILKKPPISLRFSYCDNNINYIRNTIFISINSTKQNFQQIPKRKESRPWSVEKIRPNCIDLRTPRLASNTGSRIKPRKGESQEKVGNQDENTEIYRFEYNF